jgi:tRNA modification GTPase
LREISESRALALSQANKGMLLKEGMQVVIAGEPNAGKSSLLNALSGNDSAIVTSIAGTTRDLLSEQLQIDGMPVHITDTAGLRLSEDVVEQEGIRRAADAVRKSDKVLLVIDSSVSASQNLSEDANGLHELPLSLVPKLLLDEPALFAKTLVIFNKADLTPGATLGRGALTVPASLRARDGVPAKLESITLSAKLNDGIDALRDALKESIGFNSMIEGAFVARERHLIALRAARELIASAEQCLVDGVPFELAAEDLRLAQNELGRITGQITSDDLLGEIFSTFCVGK